MKTYVIRINTKDNLYADYIVEAENLFYAKIKARNAYFNTYKDADTDIILSLVKVDTEVIREVVDIIKEESHD